jgi:hypothetical protein
MIYNLELSFMFSSVKTEKRKNSSCGTRYSTYYGRPPFGWGPFVMFPGCSRFNICSQE